MKTGDLEDIFAQKLILVVAFRKNQPERSVVRVLCLPVLKQQTN